MNFVFAEMDGANKLKFYYLYLVTCVTHVTRYVAHVTRYSNMRDTCY